MDYFHPGPFTVEFFRNSKSSPTALWMFIKARIEKNGFQTAQSSKNVSVTVEDLCRNILTKARTNISCRERSLLLTTGLRIHRQNALIRRIYFPRGNIFFDHCVTYSGVILDPNLINERNTLLRDDALFSWQVWWLTSTDEKYFSHVKYCNPYTRKRHLPDILAIICTLLWDALSLQDIIPLFDENFVIKDFDYRHFESVLNSNLEEAKAYLNQNRDTLDYVAKAVKQVDKPSFLSRKIDLATLGIQHQLR